MAWRRVIRRSQTTGRQRLAYNEVRQNGQGPRPAGAAVVEFRALIRPLSLSQRLAHAHANGVWRGSPATTNEQGRVWRGY